MELTDKVRTILDRKGRDLWSLPPDASVFDAIRLMSDKQVGALLVIEQGRLTGVVSERDYARKVILQGRSSKDTAVREIMSTGVISVAPDETIDECMRIMTAQHVRHLPVIEEGKVVGILSIGDLVKWIISAQEETIAQLHHYIAGAYPR
ncbi:MAG: CBS domain-containing protein [Acidobacteria bacterium]|nr:CBS domain-containing protein [Acidobacteriota bacterium]MBI3279830.1 CBS domain-containing protein [Acidobacteriota bacterium]